MKDGKATGEYEDFLVGFVTKEGNVWGRPVGVAVAKDGSLMVTDDGVRDGLASGVRRQVLSAWTRSSWRPSRGAGLRARLVETLYVDQPPIVPSRRH